MARTVVKLVGASALAVAALSTGAVLMASGDSASASLSAIPVLQVETIQARADTGYSITRSFAGRIEAQRTSAIGFEIGGMVTSILPEEGQRVAEGEIIANLDTALLRAQRAELVSARDRAAADEALAESTLVRVQAAFALNAIAEQAVDEAQREVNASHAALSQADAAVRSVDVRIKKATLKAPYAAVVTKRFVDEGIVVSGGSPIIELMEADRLEARIGVSGPAAKTLHKGAIVALESSEVEFEGTVKAVLPTKDLVSRSIDVIVDFDNPEGGARHGDLIRLTTRQNRDEVGFWLPLTALTESSRGLWAVYVATPSDNGEAIISRRELQVIHQETDRVFARGTLQEGEQVVSAGIQRLSPGLNVSISEHPAKFASANNGVGNE